MLQLYNQINFQKKIVAEHGGEMQFLSLLSVSSDFIFTFVSDPTSEWQRGNKKKQYKVDVLADVTSSFIRKDI